MSCKCRVCGHEYDCIEDAAKCELMDLSKAKKKHDAAKPAECEQCKHKVSKQEESPMDLGNEPVSITITGNGIGNLLGLFMDIMDAIDEDENED